MRARLRDLLENIAASLWLVPTLLALLAARLATLTLFLDERVTALGGLQPWLFGGTASAARSLLSSIAGSLITVIALAFSSTIIAIQQASSQFSPRVIRNFMRDKINQITFGSYVATFVYALLILRQVRDEPGSGSGFVPALSITVALVLALICVGLLIYFIHHTASSLQVATISAAVHHDLRQGIARLYPQNIAEASRERDEQPPTVPQAPPTGIAHSTRVGFLRNIDEEALFANLPDDATFARVRTQIGTFVFAGSGLVEVWSVEPFSREAEEGLVAAFTIGPERSLDQDLLFGIRQLVDIALKALSPGINDPTTAENCLGHLGDTVAHLGEREFPAPWRRESRSGAAVFIARPDFPQIVDAAFSQIRRAAAGDVHVTLSLIAVLQGLGERLTPVGRCDAIRRELQGIEAVLADQGFAPGDRVTIEQAFVTARTSIRA
jgi:uncharacterized membrane protein